MNGKIRFWQWPNILAIDASIIAVVWLWFFAAQQATVLGVAPYLVLALSVWLTYYMDRLVDAGTRDIKQLLSARHQFAKRCSRVLWMIWVPLLLIDVAVALTALNDLQLIQGFYLCFICLTYTCLNQLLSQRFFPKELIVAVIFAGGIQVFLPDFTHWSGLAGFALLCLVNCLMIGWKEKPVDQLLDVRSLASILDLRWGYLLLAGGIGLSLTDDGTLALFAPMLLLTFLFWQRNHFSRELFRVLCDATLLVGPLLHCLLSVLVR